MRISIYSYGGKTYLYVNGVEGCLDTENIEWMLETIAVSLIRELNNQRQKAA